MTSEGTTDGVASPRGACLAFTPQLGSARLDFRVPPGGFEISASGPATLALRRFADEFKAAIPPPAAGVNQIVAIAGDDSPLPWHAEVTTGSPVTVCPA